MTNFKAKNNQIKLINGIVSFPMISQHKVDTGWGGRGKSLTFSADFNISDNSETVKQIAEQYAEFTGKSLNAVFKQCLATVKQDYTSNNLRVFKRISDSYNLGIMDKADTIPLTFSNFSKDGNWHDIMTDVINSRLEVLQKEAGLPFFFQVEIEKTDNYSSIPKMTVKNFIVKLRQKADKKSLGFYDASIQRFDTMNHHIANNLFKYYGDGNGNIQFPQKTPEDFVKYGKDFEIFPLVNDGAVFEVNCSLFNNAKKKSLTIYPTFICMHSNPVVRTAHDDEDEEMMFAAPVKTNSTVNEDAIKQASENYDDYCPF